MAQGGIVVGGRIVGAWGDKECTAGARIDGAEEGG